jgi:hypothetical protein
VFLAFPRIGLARAEQEKASKTASKTAAQYKLNEGKPAPD